MLFLHLVEESAHCSQKNNQHRSGVGVLHLFIYLFIFALCHELLSGVPWEYIQFHLIGLSKYF